MPTSHYVYLAKCADDSFYCGYTTDVERRIREHNTGARAAKYTRSRRPIVLHYVEKYASQSQAMQREYQLKQLSHQQKRELGSADAQQ